MSIGRIRSLAPSLMAWGLAIPLFLSAFALGAAGSSPTSIGGLEEHYPQILAIAATGLSTYGIVRKNHQDEKKEQDDRRAKDKEENDKIIAAMIAAAEGRAITAAQILVREHNSAPFAHPEALEKVLGPIRDAASQTARAVTAMAADLSTLKSAHEAWTSGDTRACPAMALAVQSEVRKALAEIKPNRRRRTD